MNQAINTAVAEYGDVESWAAACGTSGSIKCTTEEAMNWFQTYIGKNLQIINIVKDPNNSNFFLVYLKDGSILEIPNYIYDIKYYINEKAINNPKKGINVFLFRFNPVLMEGQSTSSNKYTIKASFEPYAYAWDGTRDGLINSSIRYGCGEEYNHYCAKLIQYDGWQISKDYPLRF